MKNIIFALLLSLSTLFGVDIDNDLVPDTIDSCLDTPDGVFVDMRGCTKTIKRIVHFNHNSYIPDSSNIKKLKQYAQLAREAFGYKVLLKGHTDATADYKTNLILSKKRVTVVRKYLEAMGITHNRISIKWYGETIPIATNVTPRGRSLNRRVEIILQ